MQLGQSVTKFPFSISKLREIHSEEDLLKKLEQELISLDLTEASNPLIVQRDHQIMPSTFNKYLRVICRKKNCEAKLIYQYNRDNNTYKLTLYNNQHSHQIYNSTDFIGHTIKRINKQKQINQRSDTDFYQFNTLFQDDNMHNRYIRYGRCLYINVIEIQQNKDEENMILYFTGFNQLLDVVIFAVCVFDICSESKFQEIIKEFIQRNHKHPQTIVSMNQSILNIARKQFNSQCLYCSDSYLPENMKVRQGITKLLRETQTENQWEIQLRKVLILVRNSMPSSLQLKTIYDNYKNLGIFNLPPTFVNLGIYINLKELLYQHGNQYWYRYKISIEQQEVKEAFKNKHGTKTKSKKKEKKKSQYEQPQSICQNQQNKAALTRQLFIKLVPKLIQTCLPNVQMKEIMKQLDLTAKKNYKASSPNQIGFRLCEKYSPQAISYLWQQNNRALLCNLIHETRHKIRVKKPNEKDAYLIRQQQILKDMPSKIIEQETIINDPKIHKNKKWICSCGLTKKTGLPCCHILKALSIYQQNIEDYIDNIWVLEKKESKLKQQHKVDIFTQ